MDKREDLTEEEIQEEEDRKKAKKRGERNSLILKTLVMLESIVLD